MSLPHAHSATEASRSKKNLRRTAWAGIIGSVVEYYDFTLFGLAATLVFGPPLLPRF